MLVEQFSFELLQALKDLKDVASIQLKLVKLNVDFMKTRKIGMHR